jgi:hypothetical protein
MCLLHLWIAFMISIERMSHVDSNANPIFKDLSIVNNINLCFNKSILVTTLCDFEALIKRLFDTNIITKSML